MLGVSLLLQLRFRVNKVAYSVRRAFDIRLSSDAVILFGVYLTMRKVNRIFSMIIIRLSREDKKVWNSIKCEKRLLSCFIPHDKPKVDTKNLLFWITKQKQKVINRFPHNFTKLKNSTSCTLSFFTQKLNVGKGHFRLNSVSFRRNYSESIFG